MTKAYIETLLKDVGQHYSKRNFDKALELSKGISAIAQKNDLHHHLSIIQFKQGKILLEKGLQTNNKIYLEAALTLFEKVQLSIYQTDIEKITTLIELGNTHLALKNHEAAINFYNQARTYKTKTQDLTILILVGLTKVAIDQKQWENVEKYILAAESLVDNTTSIPVKIKCFEQLITFWNQKGERIKSIDYAKKVVELSQQTNDLESEAKALTVLAIPHALRGEYKEAFEYLIQSLQLSENIDLPYNSAKCLINIGNIFSALYNYEAAIRHYNRAIDQYFHVLDEKAVCILYFNLGCSYAAQQYEEKAFKYLKEALVITQKIGFYALKSRIYHELSRIYIDNEDYEKALSFSQEAEQSYQKTQSSAISEMNLADRATIFYHNKAYDKAIEYALKAIEICQKRQTTKTLKRAYRLLIDIYEVTGNLSEAFKYFKLYDKTNEKWMHEVKKRQMIDLEIQYSLLEKEREIEQLRQQMKLQKLELNHKKTLENQNTKLKMINEELKQFTYAISHDLKEPLRMISSFSKLWYRRNKKTVDERDKEYFYYITNGAERMTIMLNGLLDYAMIDKDTRKIADVDVNELMLALKETFLLKIQETNAIIETTTLPVVKTHKLLLFQLLQNLISNGLKFQRKGVTPHIFISSRETANQYIFAVKDNGIGISEEHQKAIFQVFKRLHHRDEYEGTGIGLASCYKIAHHLGGKIWLESEVGKGSTFYFSLPK